MLSGKRILFALVGLGVALVQFGCTAEAGIRDGVQDGLASAMAALIQAPVDAWLGATFP